jgi:cytochrome P450
VTRLLSPGENIYFVSDPELVKEVLVTNSAKFHKGGGVERLRPILGKGLLTSEGQVHHRQRQIIQPVFHHKSLKSYAEIMTRHASRLTGNWSDRLEIDLTAQMARLTLMIVGEALFGVNVEAETRKVGELMTALIGRLPFADEPAGPASWPMRSSKDAERNKSSAGASPDCFSNDQSPKSGGPPAGGPFNPDVRGPGCGNRCPDER